MSRPGKVIDNGPMESFFGTLKSEIYIGKEFANYKDLEMKISKFIYYYNNRRYQEKLKCMSPMEYRIHALQ